MTSRPPLYCALAVLFAGCEEEPGPKTTATSEPAAPQTEATAEKPTPSSGKGLRCDYFMSEKEAKAIGLEEFDATKEQPKPGLGVHCATSLTVFRGRDMDSMKGGAEQAEGVEKVEGPTIGQNTYWYTSSGLFGVFFLSDNSNYAGNMVGDDKDDLAKLAAKVAPHLNKP